MTLTACCHCLRSSSKNIVIMHHPGVGSSEQRLKVADKTFLKGKKQVGKYRKLSFLSVNSAEEAKWISKSVAETIHSEVNALGHKENQDFVIDGEQGVFFVVFSGCNEVIGISNDDGVG